MSNSNNRDLLFLCDLQQHTMAHFHLLVYTLFVSVVTVNGQITGMQLLYDILRFTCYWCTYYKLDTRKTNANGIIMFATMQ